MDNRNAYKILTNGYFVGWEIAATAEEAVNRYLSETDIEWLRQNGGEVTPPPAVGDEAVYALHLGEACGIPTRDNTEAMLDWDFEKETTPPEGLESLNTDVSRFAMWRKTRSSEIYGVKFFGPFAPGTNWSQLVSEADALLEDEGEIDHVHICCFGHILHLQIGDDGLVDNYSDGEPEYTYETEIEQDMHTVSIDLDHA